MLTTLGVISRTSGASVGTLAISGRCDTAGVEMTTSPPASAPRSTLRQLAANGIAVLMMLPPDRPAAWSPETANLSLAVLCPTLIGDAFARVRRFHDACRQAVQ